MDGEVERIESLLHAALASTADGILVVDSADQVSCFNHKFLELWGIPESLAARRDDEKLLQFVLSQLSNPEDFLEGVRRLYKTPDAHSRDELLFKDGRVFERITIPHRSGDTVLGRVWSFRDITERKRAEEALQQSERLFHALVSASSQSVWHYKVDGGRPIEEIDRSNAKWWCEFTGQTEAQRTANEGTGWLDAVHSEDREHAREFWDGIKLADAPLTAEFRVHRQADGWRWLELHGEPIRDRRGVITEWAGTFTDVTDRKFAEAERKRIEEQYWQAQKMDSVGQLAGGIAHDFNNLLQVILGHVEMLQLSSEPSSSDYASLEVVRSAAERAADLTQQLLAFSRRQVIQPVSLYLGELVEETLRMLRPVIGERVEIDFDCDANHGAVRADKGQFEQVLINILLNARDAMSSGGRLSIRVRTAFLDADYCRVHPDASEGEYVEVSVSDTGTGMSEETLAQIFEPYFTTKELGKGSGLGLATVYGIVKHHKGFIDVRSELGKGTEFRIFLPSVNGAALADDQTFGDYVVGGGETILVAEDEELVRELIARQLTNEGYTVYTAVDGLEALRVFDEKLGRFDLVLADVMMPRLGGRALMEQIRARFPQMRFLFSSGYSGTEIQTDFILKDGLRLINKPYHRAELLSAVRAALDAPPTPSAL